jgi:hypothetical protein
MRDRHTRLGGYTALCCLGSERNGCTLTTERSKESSDESSWSDAAALGDNRRPADGKTPNP